MINLFIIDIFSMQLHDCSAKKAFCYVVLLYLFRICTCAACSHRRPRCSCVCVIILLFYYLIKKLFTAPALILYPALHLLNVHCYHDML